MTPPAALLRRLRDPSQSPSGERAGISIWWNTLGVTLPALTGLIATPLILGNLGAERFALLSIAWLLTGNLNFFELGLSRAMTQVVAFQRPTLSAPKLLALVTSGLWMLAGVGMLAGSAVVLSAVLTTKSTFSSNHDIPPTEIITSALILATALPLVSMTSGLRGVLEAFGDFKGANAARIPNGVLGFLFPLGASYHSANLSLGVAGLFISRAISGALLRRRLSRRHGLREHLLSRHFDAAAARTILQPALWFALTGLTTFAISYSDRLILGGHLGLFAFGWYTLYVDLVSRALFLPATVTQVYFPRFSRHQLDHRQLFREARASLIWVSIMTMVVAATAALLAPQLIVTLTGEHDPPELPWVLYILLAGLVFNGIALVPLALLQGAGRARTVSLVYIFELSLYLPGLVVLVSTFGMAGAAVAWTIRSAVDAIVLSLFGLRFIRHRSER